LDKVQEEIQRSEPLSATEQVDAEVFKHSFIPRTLDEVIDVERDLERASKGQTDGILYQVVIGLKEDLSGALKMPTLLEQDSNTLDEVNDSSDSNSEGTESDTESENTDSEENERTKEKVVPPTESAEEKRERKKTVKETNKERRKTKTPKHIKKQKKKTSKEKSQKKK